MTFEKATLQYKEKVLNWLDKPYVKEFWDNSDAYRLDLDIFMAGRKIQSPYFDGIFDYWIGLNDGEPFCLMMSNQVSGDDDIPDLWKSHLSKLGHTVSLDFMIGEEKFLGKGFAAKAINEFILFYRSMIDVKADMFLIDPDSSNQKALRAYENAGFIRAGDFLAVTGVYEGNETTLMTKRI